MPNDYTTADSSKIALITGGSSGIGFTISRYFAREGYTLLWVSLLEDELQESKAKLQSEYKQCDIHTLSLDLSREDSADKVYQWVNENAWQVEVVINNAGFGVFGFVQENDPARELQMIQLNVLNLYKLTRLFLDEMLKRNQGTIINIASNSAFTPAPKLAVYSATKAFVNHFTRALHEELKMQKSKVRVISVCPAAISNTNFKTTNQMAKVRTFNGLATTTAEEVARDVWRGFTRGKNFVVTGWKMRFLYAISDFVPYDIQQFIVRQEIKET
jgi:short-subunit dehydrogenase